MGIFGISEIIGEDKIRMIKYILETTGFLLLGVGLLAGCGSSASTNQAANGGKWQTIPANGSPSSNVAPSSTIEAPITQDIKDGGFNANLPPDFAQPSDETGRKLLKEYGAVFLARGGATPPKTVVFRDEGEVAAFQANVSNRTETIGGVSIRLQAAAMDALQAAAAEANQNGVSITPKGADAASRSYQDTVGLWASRVDPALEHWTAKGRIPAAEAKRIRSLPPFEQVAEILKLESKGIYFSRDLAKSIVYSVAPPGSSQHLSMLALDVTEHDNARVRTILAKHGWFQTVISDLPHFTFLGVPEKDLPKLGLKRSEGGGRVFWVPDI